MDKITKIEKLLIEKKEDVEYYLQKQEKATPEEKKYWEQFGFNPSLANLEDAKLEVEALELLFKEEKGMLQQALDHEAEELKAAEAGYESAKDAEEAGQ